MRTEGLTKTFIADEAIGARLCVKIGSADGKCGVADAATDYIIGVSDSLGAAASGDRCDVIMDGIAEVVFGDTVTRGQFLTAETNGRAVPAAPAATATARIIGIAMVSGVDGDIGTVMLNIGGSVTNGANA